MSDIKTKYPASGSTPITCDISSLASSTVFAGRASTFVDNTTNCDLDHIISGKITLGTTPTVSKQVLVYIYLPLSVTAGVPTWPDGITGTDANKTLTSVNSAINMLRAPIWSGSSDAVTGRVLNMPGCSLVWHLGYMPQFYGLFVVHETVAALNSTSGNHEFNYQRDQAQSV